MRLPVQFSDRRALQFNITPLIDIVFLLIIFFLVASHFVRSDNSEAVELPLVPAAMTDENPAHRVTITILADGSYSIGGTRFARDIILLRISGLAANIDPDGSPPEVRIRADRDGQFGMIRPLIEQCARHNIRSVQLAVSTDPS
ncbi:MAG: biopolymer transporter ExbD [Planctomycetaceae bacterium]|jgi:biopolymer transport protein ExbD